MWVCLEIKVSSYYYIIHFHFFVHHFTSRLTMMHILFKRGLDWGGGGGGKERRFFLWGGGGAHQPGLLEKEITFQTVNA